ncbi:DUF6463 family protein [Kribbella sp. C-35]|uniref:DUF6463 family protein n=1 Tax=Kribbella sp. C-35 TaxID=2789276 RepID=UPI00397BEBB7
MNASGRMLRWAGGIMLALGTGHLLLSAVFAREQITGWVDRGVWAAVPLALTAIGTDQTAESLQNQATFWAAPGSFAVPLILLGGLTWHLAGRGVALPPWIGWALAVWCLLAGILLVPSPYFAGIISGALIITANRKQAPPQTAHDRQNNPA